MWTLSNVDIRRKDLLGGAMAGHLAGELRASWKDSLNKCLPHWVRVLRRPNLRPWEVLSWTGGLGGCTCRRLAREAPHPRSRRGRNVYPPPRREPGPNHWYGGARFAG